MKMTKLAVLLYSFFGFASTVHAQNVVLDNWTCSASPYIEYGQGDTFCYGVQETYTSSSASASSTGNCHNSAVIGTYASAATTATLGGTAESYADAVELYYVGPPYGVGKGTFGYTFGWDSGANLKPEAQALKYCTGNTATVTEQNSNCVAIGICVYVEATLHF